MVSANTQSYSPASSMLRTAATTGEPSVVASSVGSAGGSAGMAKSVKVVGSEVVVYWLRYELSVLMSASTKLSTVGVLEVVSVVEVGVVLEAVVEGVGSSTLHRASEQPRFAPPEFN